MGIKVRVDTFDMYQFMKEHGLTTEEISDIVAKAANDGLKIFMQYAPYDTKNTHNYHSSDFAKISQVRIYPNASYVDIGYLAEDWKWHKQAYFQNYDVSSPNYHWFNKAQKAIEPVVIAKMEALANQVIASKN